MGEVEKRRPDWKPGTPIVLGDAEEWHLPAVPCHLETRIEAGAVVLRPQLPEALEAILVCLYGAEAEGNDLAAWFLIREAAAWLLVQNYDLSFADVAGLMPFGPWAPGYVDASDEQISDNARMVVEIREHIAPALRSLEHAMPPPGMVEVN